MTGCRTISRSILIFLLAVAMVVQVHGDDWPQFLGPQRNGVSTESGLISEWPVDGPTIVWRTPLGVSMSGIAVSNGRAFTMFQDDNQQYVVALTANDGKEVWRTAVAPMFVNSMGNGPRATPTVSGDHVFAFTGEGILAAFRTSDGKQVWSVDVPKSLDGIPAEYGVSCSPIVAGDRVVVHAGTESAAVAAYDRATGKVAWKSGKGKSGYSSPVLMTLAGSEQLVTFTAAGATGLDPASGKSLWEFSFRTEYDCNIAVPVRIDPDSLLISAGENHGSVILKLSAEGDRFKPEEIWSSPGRTSQLRAEWQTPVIHDGHLYALDNSGSAGPITNLVCIRLSDLKTMWQKIRFGKSNLILADGKLFLTTMNGDVVIVDASPAAFNELGRATIMETTRQAPALANGFLFVRDDKEVICIDVRAAN